MWIIYNLQTDLQIQTWIQKEGTIWYFVGRAIRRFSKTRVKKTLAKRKISSPHSEPSDSEEELCMKYGFKRPETPVVAITKLIHPSVPTPIHPISISKTQDCTSSEQFIKSWWAFVTHRFWCCSENRRILVLPTKIKQATAWCEWSYGDIILTLLFTWIIIWVVNAWWA